MGRFVPDFGGLKRGIDLIMFGKQSILVCANFYVSGEMTWEFRCFYGSDGRWQVALVNLE